MESKLFENLLSGRIFPDSVLSRSSHENPWWDDFTDIYGKYPISSNYEGWYGKGFAYAQSVVREKLEEESANKSIQEAADQNSGDSLRIRGTVYLIHHDSIFDELRKLPPRTHGLQGCSNAYVKNYGQIIELRSMKKASDFALSQGFMLVIKVCLRCCQIPIQGMGKGNFGASRRTSTNWRDKRHIWRKNFAIIIIQSIRSSQK